jgi:hypothetical protein
MTVASDCLIVAGGVVQCGGFALTLRQSASVRRNEVPEQKSPLVQLGGSLWSVGRSLSARTKRLLLGAAIWILKRVGLNDKASSIALQLPASLGFESRLETKLKTDRPELHLDLRMAHLEQGMNELRAILEGRIDQVRGEIESAVSEIESNRLAGLRRSLFWEEVGILMFLAGIVLSVAGAIA